MTVAFMVAILPERGQVPLLVGCTAADPRTPSSGITSIPQRIHEPGRGAVVVGSRRRAAPQPPGSQARR